MISSFYSFFIANITFTPTINYYWQKGEYIPNKPEPNYFSV